MQEKCEPVAITLIKHYKKHQIYAGANEGGPNSTWIPVAVISQAEPSQYKTLCGSNPCPTPGQAILSAVKLGIEWIDRKGVESESL